MDNVCGVNKLKQHLFFECGCTRDIWLQVLNWLKVVHTPSVLDNELQWILRMSKGKGMACRMLKLAFTETVYAVWQGRNAQIFQNADFGPHIVRLVLEAVKIRASTRSDLGSYCTRLV